MKLTWEEVTGILAILGAIGAAIVWVIGRIDKAIEAKEKDRQEKEQAIAEAKRIAEKLLHLESNYGRLMEEREEFRKEVRQENQQLRDELHEVRQDFGRFVQQLFFKQSK